MIRKRYNKVVQCKFNQSRERERWRRSARTWKLLRDKKQLVEKNWLCLPCTIFVHIMFPNFWPLLSKERYLHARSLCSFTYNHWFTCTITIILCVEQLNRLDLATCIICSPDHDSAQKLRSLSQLASLVAAGIVCVFFSVCTCTMCIFIDWPSLEQTQG